MHLIHFIHLFILSCIVSKAASIIAQHNKSEPMFLYLAFQSPHMKVEKPPEKYLVIPYSFNICPLQLIADTLILNG